jgi:hypothetical protein
MRALIEELFGATRIEREREIEHLLSLPLPMEDPQEHEPTRVFVQRAGVRPDRPETRSSVRVEAAQPPDSQDLPADVTKQVDRTLVDPPSIPPTVATEVANWSKESSGNHSARMQFGRDPASGSFSPLSPIGSAGLRSGPEPDPNVMPFLTHQLVPPRRSGVSVAVLAASVAAAAIIGAVVAVAVSRHVGSNVRYDETPTVIQPVNEAPVVVQVAPKAPAERVIEPVEETAPAEVEVEPPRKRREARRETRVEAPAPAETAPAPTLEDEVRELIAAADGLIQRLPEGTERSKAIQIKLDLKRDLTAPDRERVKASLRQKKRELEALR